MASLLQIAVTRNPLIVNSALSGNIPVAQNARRDYLCKFYTGLARGTHPQK
jgi:hypothetical protein